MNDLRGTAVGGHYTIEREIGRGGMATVWLASDARHDRRVAIKIIHPELAGALGTERFLRELRVTARMQHPNVVPILDSGVVELESANVPWYAMPYLDGEALRDRLDRERQLPIAEALRITDAVGRALAAAHREHVVHRDVKPENIFLVGDQVYVVDFGIAKNLAATAGDRLTSTGLSVGSPAYMSPEQATGEPVDERTDQYSLAAVLYEMIAGEPPFTGPNAQAVIARRLTESPRRLTTIRPAVPPAVEHAVLRALQRAPADRFARVEDFLAALRASDAPPEKRSRGRRVSVVALSVVLVVAAISVFAATRGGARARDVDPGVLALYRRGVRGFDSRTAPAVIEGIAAFRAAIARDSTYAPAWTGLAKAYARAYGRGFDVPDVARNELLPRALAAVDRALALDSASADAWATHATVSFQVDPANPAIALRSARRALAIDSGSAYAWQTLALHLADSGDLTAAIGAWKRAARIAPRYPEPLAFLALAYHWRRSFDTAAAWADSAVSVDPNYVLARNAAGSVFVERGEYARAEAAFEAMRNVSTDVEVANALAGTALARARAGDRGAAEALLREAESQARGGALPMHTAIELAKAYAALDRADDAVLTLRRFRFARHSHFQLHLRCDPPFDALVSHPGFRSLMIGAPRVRGAAC